jgi:membrane-associated phospholipid phosphatase
MAGFLICLIAFWILIPNASRTSLAAALLAQRGLMAAMFLFLLVALSLLWARGQELDNRVFLFVNLWGKRPFWLDALMWLATQAGNGLTAFIIALLQFRIGDRGFAFALILGTLTLGLMVESLKWLTNRARPFLVNEQARIVGLRAPGRSFPSGHTSQAFFLMTMLNNHFHPSLGIAALLFVAAVVVGVTRVYLGAHFPRDVLGGTVLGLGWGILITLVDPYSFIHLPF